MAGYNNRQWFGVLTLVTLWWRYKCRNNGLYFI